MRKTLATVTAVGLLALSVPTSADAPTVTILSPTAASTVFSATFPFVQPIAFAVSHAGVTGRPRDITDVRNLEVLIDGTPIAGSLALEPWKVGSSAQCNLAAPYTACAVPDVNNGTATIGWTVPAPGQYAITVRAYHTGDEGQAVENVTFAMLNAEYPAPPAVANAYIKTLGKLSGKVHGCVISKIAEHHAKYETYGPKGGPYLTSAIEADVTAFIGQCGG